MTSRVARNPVSVPKGVEVKISGNHVAVKGKKGAMELNIHDTVKIAQEEDRITFAPADDSIAANAMSGTMRALVNNMVIGVSDGFEKKLVLLGVGYRAKAQGRKLDLTLGFSHPVNVEMPEGVDVATPSQTEVILSGCDKQKVSQIAANIRAIRPPEPYKGKGIRYFGEQIQLKEGKKK